MHSWWEYAYLSVSICVYVCVCTSLCVCLCLCLSLYVCVGLCESMYVSVCVYSKWESLSPYRKSTLEFLPTVSVSLHWYALPLCSVVPLSGVGYLGGRDWSGMGQYAPSIDGARRLICIAEVTPDTRTLHMNDRMNEWPNGRKKGARKPIARTTQTGRQTNRDT